MSGCSLRNRISENRFYFKNSNDTRWPHFSRSHRILPNSLSPQFAAHCALFIFSVHILHLSLAANSEVVDPHYPYRKCGEIAEGILWRQKQERRKVASRGSISAASASASASASLRGERGLPWNSGGRCSNWLLGGPRCDMFLSRFGFTMGFMGWHENIEY